MKKYESYKPSGVEWIGDIPKNWSLRKGSSLGSYSKGAGIKKDEVKSIGIPCIRYGEIYTYYDISFTSAVSFVSEDIAKIYVSKGALLFTASGETLEEIGRCTVYLGEKDLAVGGDIIILKATDNLNPNFLAYSFNSEPIRVQKELEGRGGIIVHIYSKGLRNIWLPVPPLSEQSQIVAYLDRKTALIDALIEKTERKIALLKEKRTALINQAVTKGLDPTVPMKDSGVEWIGEIPEHWGVVRISWGFKTIGSGTTPRSGKAEYYDNGDINWLMTGDLNNSVINRTSKKVTKKALNDYSALKLHEAGGIVIAMYGATIGKLGVLNVPTTTNQACCVLSDPTFFDTNFVFMFLLGFQRILVSMGYGGGQPNISQDLIRSMQVTLPPASEQREIADYLSKNMSLIDSVELVEKKRIRKLKEYRQALISEVVTGKLKVSQDD